MVVVEKQNKRKTNKKVVVPNAAMWTPHGRCLVEVQALGKVDHRNTQWPNGDF